MKEGQHFVYLAFDSRCSDHLTFDYSIAGDFVQSFLLKYLVRRWNGFGPRFGQNGVLVLMVRSVRKFDDLEISYPC